MNIIGILILLIVLVLLYFLIRYMTSDVNTLSSLQSGQIMKQIAPTSLAQNGNGSSSSNYTYSMWFYITDWNYRYGEPKVLFGRMGKTSSAVDPRTGVSGIEPCPVVTLGAIENNLTVSLAVFPNTSSSSSSVDASNNYIVHNCMIQNVPIQSWVNLLISTYGNVLDVYLDGKLVRTCVLPGVAQVNTNANVYITPKGGFAGYTSKFQYYPNATDPQTAWNIYQQGYNTSWWSNIFGGSYQVQVSILNNGQTQSTFTT